MQMKDFVIGDLNFQHIIFDLDPFKGFMKNAKRKIRVGNFGEMNCYRLVANELDQEAY